MKFPASCSQLTGADIHDAAVITCACGASITVSGTAALPDQPHAHAPAGNSAAGAGGGAGSGATGKIVEVKIVGDRGVLLYGGDDTDPASGKLELRRAGGPSGAPPPSTEFPAPSFAFENCDAAGDGPESLQAFLAHCLDGRGHAAAEARFVGADVAVGLKTVQTVEAMYRSAAAGQSVDVL